jgi:hypothetical protein
MAIIQTLWLGVISSVLATLFVVFLRRLPGQLISMIGGLVARSVEGTWNTKFKKGKDTFKELAKVHQVLHGVWGTIEYPNKKRIYKFRGTVRENVLIATYEVTERRSTIDRGAFTLAVNSTGEVRKMIGLYSWTDDDSSIPEGDKYEWDKQV